MSDVLNLAPRLTKALAAQYVANFPGAVIVTPEGPQPAHLEKWYNDEIAHRWPDVKYDDLENEVLEILSA